MDVSCHKAVKFVRTASALVRLQLLLYESPTVLAVGGGGGRVDDVAVHRCRVGAQDVAIL